MVFPQKRVLIFLFAAMVLAASPALSVPLSSGVENPGPSYTDPDGETTVPVDGTAGIVDHQTVAMTESHATEEAGPHPEMGMGGASGGAAMGGGGGMPGWVMPAAGIGAGGAAIAVLAHGNGKSSGTSGLDASGGMGSGGGIGAMGTSNDGTPGGSSDVPEPGTIMLMGAGIASFLGRRRLFSK